MRRFPTSWNSTLAALGLKKKHARQADHRGRQCRSETLEQRQMLAADTAAVPARATWELVSWADGAVPEQFKIDTEYSASGAAVAVISLDDKFETLDTTYQELSLELRLGGMVLATQEITVDLAEVDFRNQFHADRLQIAREETADISTDEARDALSQQNAPEDLTTGLDAALAAIAAGAERLAQIAEQAADFGDLLQDPMQKQDFYASIATAIREMNAAKDSETADATMLAKTEKSLGNTVLLLSEQFAEDLAVGDTEITTAVEQLLDEASPSLPVYYTTFNGLGRNEVLVNRNVAGGSTVIAAMEAATFDANQYARFELGSEPAIVSSNLQVGAAQEAMLTSLTSSGVLSDDTFVGLWAPDTAYGTDAMYEDSLYAFTIPGSSYTSDTYLRFDLSAQQNVNASQASLALETLSVSNGTTGTPEISLSAHRDLFGLTTASTLDEDTLTWNESRSIFDGFSATYDENFSTSLAKWDAATGTADYDVTEAVRRATLAGDSNFSGGLDLDGATGDIESFYLAITDWDRYVSVFEGAVASEADLVYANDVNWDGVVDIYDAAYMFQRWGAVRGDVTHDGVVDSTDFARWTANYGTKLGSGLGFGYGGHGMGDANADGMIDAIDYAVITEDSSSTSSTPLTPSVIFRVTTDDGTAVFASKEHASAAAPDLQIVHDGDIEVTEFATSGTDLKVRYSIHNTAFSNTNIEVYRVPHDGTLAANGVLLMTQSVSGSVGQHTETFSADFSNDAANEDYRLEVKVTGTPTSGTESDLADNERDFTGGVFVNAYDGALHIHGGTENDSVRIGDDLIELTGSRSMIMSYGSGEVTFIDDDSVANGLVHSDEHPNAHYVAPTTFYNPNTNFNYTWGDDRDHDYASSSPSSGHATWTFTGLQPGIYQVSATWQPHSNRTKEAGYRFIDGARVIGWEHVSQESLPTADHTEVHSQVPGKQIRFKDLGAPLSVNSGVLRVELPRAFDGRIIADAVRLERIDAPVPTGAVYVRGQGGDDFIAADNDLSFAITAFGGNGEDTLYGGPNDDVLVGGMGADTIFGNDGADTLYGAFMVGGYVDDGADSLYGGAGADTLHVDYTYTTPNDPDVLVQPRPSGADYYEIDGDTIVDSNGVDPAIVGDSWTQELLWSGNYGFGAGWNLPGIDRLEFTGSVSQPTSLTWVRSDGHAVSFSDNAGTWTADSGDPTAAEITYDSQTQRLVKENKYGATAEYAVQATGLALLALAVDRHGVGRKYVYSDEDGDGDATEISEVRIVRPDQTDEVTTYTYSVPTNYTEERATKITDPFGREVDVSYDSTGRVEKIELPSIEVANDYLGTYLVSERPITSFIYEGDFISRVDEPDNYESESAADIYRDYTWDDIGGGLRGELWVEDRDPNPERYLGAPYDVYMKWAGLTGAWESYLPAFLLTDGLDTTASTATRSGYYVDEAGRTTIRTVNGDGATVETKSAIGTTTSYLVNDGGLPTSMSLLAPGDDRVIESSSYVFDTDYNLLSATHADGNTESWTYGVNAQVEDHTDELGRVTDFTLLTNGDVSESRIIVGEDDRASSGVDDDIVSTYVWTADGLLSEQVDIRRDETGAAQTSLVTRYTYTTVDASGPDFIGRWLETTTYGGDDTPLDGMTPTALVNQSSFGVTERDIYGNATEITDEVDRTTEYLYDALDRLRVIRQPTGNGPVMRTDYTFTARGRLAYTVTGAEEDVEAFNNNSPAGLNYTTLAPALNPITGGGGGSGSGGSSGSPEDARFDANNYDACDCEIEESLDCWGDPSKEGTSYNPDGTTSGNTGPNGQSTGNSFGAGLQPVLLASTAGGGGSGGGGGSSSTIDLELVSHYDARGLLVGRRDASGVVTRFVHDERRREIATVTGSGVTTALDYTAAGELATVTDGEGRTTKYTYDDAGRLASVTDPGDDGVSSTYVYDTVGNKLAVTDPNGNETQYVYDERSRLVTEIDADGFEIDYDYFDDNRLQSLTDPNGNETSWTYDAAGRVATETNEFNQERSYEYDGYGRLAKMTDREGRVTSYEYDPLHNLTSEKWYADEADFLASNGGVNDTHEYEFTFDYDLSSRMIDAKGRAQGAQQDAFDYDFHYDTLNRLQGVEQELEGLATVVNLDSDYDAAGRLASTLVNFGGYFSGGGGNDDIVFNGIDEYANTYAYDTAGRMTSVVQTGQGTPGASVHAVADKRVDFSYNRANQFVGVSRYASTDQSAAVARTAFSYEATGLLSQMAHYENPTAGGALLAGYGYTYDVGDRIAAIDFLPSAYNSEDVTYTYDDRNQIDTANYGGGSVEEDYAFDDNGNRVGNQTIGGQTESYAATSGTNNQLTFDGTHTYVYDDEGNRTRKYIDVDQSGTLNTGDTDITEYDWDHRNRLTKVTDRAAFGGAATQAVEYAYDHLNQLISRTVDADGDPGTTGDITQTKYVFGNGQVVLQFEKTGAGTVGANDLSNRYLWGPMVDQLLADEKVDDLLNAANNETLWALTDHLGTVRDSVDDTGAVVNHKEYDSFGNVTAESDLTAAKDVVFGYTGKLFDEDTKLQNNLNRWYDASVGKWASEDPIGFAAGDANLHRYTGGQPTSNLDPSGLVTLGGGYGVDVSWGPLHFAFEYNVHVGFSWNEGFTCAAGPGAQAGIGLGGGPGLGGGASYGPHASVTNAASAHDLAGKGSEYGAWVAAPGGGGGAGFITDAGSIQDFCLGNPKYGGVEVALPIPGISGGAGGGIYGDSSAYNPAKW